MRTHYIKCKDCHRAIAQWGGGMNWQKEAEWVCQGKIIVDCEKENVFLHKDGTRSHTFVMDGGVGTIVDTPAGAVKLKQKKCCCSVVNDTTYCGRCAKKHGYKCPICGGQIVKERSA